MPPQREPSAPRQRLRVVAASDSRTRRSTRLISYVEYDSGGADAIRERERVERKSETSRAAVKRVMEWEKAQEREPIEMDFYNVGYDVESTDNKGQKRFIEIKGIAGAWTELGIGISAAQFEMARKSGSAWWLYVVPFAIDDELAKVIPIQSPTEQITNYRFDKGWMNAGPRLIDEAPEVGDLVSILGSEPAKIVGTTRRGKLWSLAIDSAGTTKTILFNPVSMVLTKKGGLR